MMHAKPQRVLSIAFTDRRLCTRCGTCTAVCPTGAIAPGADAWPGFDEARCIDCGLCARACPGGRVSFAQLAELTFGRADTEASFDGHTRAVYVGHATRPATRERGAGGGVVTALLSHWLESGAVDGCVVTRMRADAPWQGEPFVARTPAELAASQSSRYLVIPVNAALRGIRNQPGRLAVAALPCQVHGLRLMLAACPELADKIYAIVGLYCGSSLEPCVTADLLKARGIRPQEIAAFQFRGGAWPGRMRAVLADGRTRHLHPSNYRDGAYNYLVGLYAPERCRTCIDGSSCFADISVSDMWARDVRGAFRFREQSRLRVRTERGAEGLAAARRAGVIEAADLADDPAAATHPIQTRRKAVVTPLRVARLKRAGRAAPDYDRPVPAVGAAVRRRERLLSWLQDAFRSPRRRYALMAVLTSRAGAPLIALRSGLKRLRYRRRAR